MRNKVFLGLTTPILRGSRFQLNSEVQGVAEPLPKGGDATAVPLLQDTGGLGFRVWGLFWGGTGKPQMEFEGVSLAKRSDVGTSFRGLSLPI